MRRKVVCFDLDDTLYKEVDYLFSGYRKIAKTIEERTGKEDVFQKMCLLRRESKNVFEEIEKEYEGVINKVEMLRIYREHMPTITLEYGVDELLTILKEHGCVLGLITDGRSLSQKNKIKALGLERWFSKDDIVISEEFGSEKPDERNYQYFVERYPKGHYYYVGDNPKKDFLAPNNLGWDSICILDDGRNIHKQDFSLSSDFLPKKRIKNITELMFLEQTKKSRKPLWDA